MARINIYKIKEEQKRLEENNTKLFRENREFREEISKLKEENRQLQMAYAENQGKIQGIRETLEKLCIDSNLSLKKMSEKELFEKIENKRLSNRW